MSEQLFVHRGSGSVWPEYMVVDLRNGLLRFSVRGEPIVEPVAEAQDGEAQVRLLEGARAELTLPAAAVMRLMQALLELPPVGGIPDAKPFVLWFVNAEARAQYVATIREACPDIEEHALDRVHSSPGG